MRDLRVQLLSNATRLNHDAHLSTESGDVFFDPVTVDAYDAIVPESPSAKRSSEDGIVVPASDGESSGTS